MNFVKNQYLTGSIFQSPAVHPCRLPRSVPPGPPKFFYPSVILSFYPSFISSMLLIICFAATLYIIKTKIDLNGWFDGKLFCMAEIKEQATQVSRDY